MQDVPDMPDMPVDLPFVEDPEPDFSWLDELKDDVPQGRDVASEKPKTRKAVRLAPRDKDSDDLQTLDFDEVVDREGRNPQAATVRERLGAPVHYGGPPEPGL